MTSILGSLEEEDKTLTLRIGRKNLKDKTLAVSPHKIYSAQEGRSIPFSKMIKDMKGSDFIYIGETHTSLPMHHIQLQIIQALYEQDRNLCIGLEMFPVTFQDILNKWSLGILSIEEFIRDSQWYVNWNYNFGFYQQIFLLGKMEKIPFYALNAPREIVSKIRVKGWNFLSDEEKNIVPNPDLSHEEHRFLIRTIFENTELPHQMKGKSLEMAFEGLYRAQSAWDEVMAANIIKAQSTEAKKIVVLAGSGHLFYNLGINRRVFEKNHRSYKTVLCVTIPEGRESLTVAWSLADYIWGLPQEKRPAFPLIGLNLKKFEGLDNLVIADEPIAGVALNAGFEKGDVILSVDGHSFSDINDLRVYLASFTWNDVVEFRILRDAKEVRLDLKFEPSDKGEDKKNNAWAGLQPE